MTIEDIAKKLDDCGNHRTCGTCEFGFGLPTESCRADMILAMGSECRRVAEEMNDDGK